MRSIIPFNDEWLYNPHDIAYSAGDDGFETVTLPHTNILLPQRNFDNQEYQFISTYRKRFSLPEPLNGRRLFIDFEGAMTSATVIINSHTLGEHDGGYVPFSFDLTDHLRDGENLLQVRLDSTERPDVPPNGHVVDYLTFGGIYREVSLRYVDLVHIESIFVRTLDVLTDAPKVEVDLQIVNQSARDAVFNCEVFLQGDGDETLKELGIPQSVFPTSKSEKREIVVPANGGVSTTVRLDSLREIHPIHLWTLDDPHLYPVVIKTSVDGQRTGIRLQMLGFREAVFKDDGFYLNGEHLKLIGLNRHQTFPYIGGAAPERLQRKDADILKYELGVNIVRTSHYPQSRHFLDRCDEIGLLVLEEIPGWQFIGDDDWKALSLHNLEAMITRDRNHPAIVLWGVRINESWDDEAFYTATNALAHKLDPTRQTGGIRNFQESQFLEDVFTYNDFSNTIVKPLHTPHLVTEHNGHMFSTKTCDQEERQIEHALRHARVQDKQMGMGNVAGAIGWCAFDYNTHLHFGSGDRVCYHGVMDIFRLPKFAAYLYAAQGVKPPFVQVASFWTPGDRGEGGNDPLTIFSNCEEVEIYVDDCLFGRFQPDHVNFPNLPHPPILAAGLSLGMINGANYADLHAVGYINDEVAADQWIEAGSLPRQLMLTPDDTQLHADGADMTRLAFKVADKYGNRLPHADSIISFEIDGPGELIGDNPFALIGGQGALYVKARKQAGVVTVRATARRLPMAEIEITIE